MFLAPKFNKFFTTKSLLVLAIGLITNSITLNAVATQVEFIGSITKGSCYVVLPTQEVLFPGGVIVTKLKDDVSDKTYTMPFTFQYKCQDFDLTTSLQTVIINITPSAGTDIANNIIYPNTPGKNLNAGFILTSCDQDKKNCNPVTFSPEGKVPFQVIKNGELESHFEVSIVKLNNQPAKAGELTASVDLTLIQP